MHVRITPEQEAFRLEAARWLEANVPGERRPAFGPDMAEFDRAWQRRLHEAGWAGVSWPREYGGRGLSPVELVLWWQECVRFGAPPLGVNFVGIAHAGPTLIAQADDVQRATYLPPILSADEIWCQGFSEPDAGSDLGALRTRAIRDGDQLVVTGQKVWTGYAQFADRQELLVRTSPGDRKYDGLSWVVCDMRAPGVTVRPISTMDGGAHVCEVFYDEVRIPLSDVVGGIDRGWSVAMANLGFERATAQTGAQLELLRTVHRLAALARSLPGRRGGSLLSDDDGVRRSLAQLTAEAHGLRSLTYATASADESRGPGAEGAVVRLYFTELVQRVQAFAVELLGERTALLDPDDLDGRAWVRDYLVSFKETIAGGTNDIQRNTIARHVLGLPRSR